MNAVESYYSDTSSGLELENDSEIAVSTESKTQASKSVSSRGRKPYQVQTETTANTPGKILI